MKKSKLIVGILLMILGIGISMGSVVLHHFEYGRYGMVFPRQRIVNGNGAGGYRFRDFPQRPFNSQPNQQPGRRPNTNPSPKPNQNQGQNSNGGVTQ